MSEVKPYTREEIASLSGTGGYRGGDCNHCGWAEDRLLATLAAVEAERDEARREVGDLARYRNEKAALVRTLKLPEKACWGATLTAIAAALAEVERLKEALKGVLQHGESLKNAWINDTHDVLYVDRWNSARSLAIAALAPQPEVKGEQP